MTCAVEGPGTPGLAGGSNRVIPWAECLERVGLRSSSSEGGIVNQAGPSGGATLAASSRIVLTVNGARKQLDVASWTTLLDALREHLGLTGTKKGCDHG